MFPSCLAIIAAALLCSTTSFSAELEPVEGPPLVFAHDLVREELRSGDRFKLAPIAHVVNFGYEFDLDSDFGDFHARGIKMLEMTAHEIEALEKLEEISKTKAFATSFSEALKNPLVRSWAVARRPITTVTRIPGGIIRYLQGKFFEVKRGSEKLAAKSKEYRFRGESKVKEPVGEKMSGAAKKVGSTTKKLSRRHLGFDKAKRDWSRRLKVDPYTTNDYLQFELERIAWASTVGSFAGEFAIPTSSVLSYTLQAQEMVWSKSEVELERLNSSALKKMGVDTSVLVQFDELDHYTLTEKTELVLTLEGIDVDGRLELIQLLLEVGTREEAMLMLEIVSAIGSYHTLVKPIEKVAIRRGLAVCYDKEGTMMLPLALDYLHWSPEISDALLANELYEESRALWISGTASAIAKRRLASHDWKLEEKCFDKFASLRPE